MIDYHRLKSRAFPGLEQTYGTRETMLYALAVGFGFDPLDERQLAYVYEPHLQAVPTLAAVLAHPGFWMNSPDTGIDWVKVVHGEQRLRLHAPLPVAGRVVGHNRVKSLVDKGRDRGALVLQERTLHDAQSGALLATIEQLAFCRGDGGFSERPGNGPAGGDAAPEPLPPTPGGTPDVTCDLPTLPQSALLYRLCGDHNPLHADPAVARAAGFPRPILHGLATYGACAHAILRTCCDYQASRIRSIDVRFSAPVFPGETLRTDIWRAGERVYFRARALGSADAPRDVVVLSNGVAEIG